MKKILIFIGLKIVEIIGGCGIILAFYYLGLFAEYLRFPIDAKPYIFLRCLAGFFFSLIMVMVICGIYHAIKANWDWAGRIARKK